MKRPLFLAGFGDFLSVKVNAFAPRFAYRDILDAKDDQERELRRRRILEEISGVAAGQAEVQETAHTFLYNQAIRHPRIEWGTRQLEIWKREPRAMFTFRFYRKSSLDPERFFVAFPLPCAGMLPWLSNGGVPFVPFKGQLPGTCRDYFAIDGWAHYATADGHWLWASRDAALVTLGSSSVAARRKNPPKDTGRLLATIYDNLWHVNFVGDSPGVMEFQFELVWKAELEKSTRVEDIAESLLTEPVVMINPEAKEDPIVIRRLYQP
jgi:hypothetical protein